MLHQRRQQMLASQREARIVYIDLFLGVDRAEEAADTVVVVERKRDVTD